MDVVKLIFVAGVVGGLFVATPFLLRIIGFITLTTAFMISVMMFPKNPPREG